MSGVVVRDLGKRFGKVVAVDDVSFEVDKRTLALLGPSGCGKTTTLRCIAGLEDPDEGEIYIEDRLVSAPKRNVLVPPEKRNIGMVFQSYALWPHLTVYDNVAYGLKRRHFPKHAISERVRIALELVELTGLKDRYPSQLSGGQQQRVALARALVYEPKILLLDEPLSNLDAKLRERTRGELKRLLRQVGITSVYVTHDQEEAFVVSDRLMIMNQGQMMQEGTPEEIYERPVNEFVAEFMGRVNIFAGRVESVGEDFLTVALPDLGTVLHTRKLDGISGGDECFASLRAHRINISLEKPGKTNIIQGEVVLKEYKGANTDYRVRVGSKEVVVSSPVNKFSEGSKVYLHVDSENIVTVPKR